MYTINRVKQWYKDTFSPRERQDHIIMGIVVAPVCIFALFGFLQVIGVVDAPAPKKVECECVCCKEETP